jgi:hypothetical protein
MTAFSDVMEFVKGYYSPDRNKDGIVKNSEIGENSLRVLGSGIWKKSNSSLLWNYDVKAIVVLHHLDVGNWSQHCMITYADSRVEIWILQHYLKVRSMSPYFRNPLNLVFGSLRIRSYVDISSRKIKAVGPIPQFELT